jgi:hypothetical protein
VDLLTPVAANIAALKEVGFALVFMQGLQARGAEPLQKNNLVQATKILKASLALINGRQTTKLAIFET